VLTTDAANIRPQPRRVKKRTGRRCLEVPAGNARGLLLP